MHVQSGALDEGFRRALADLGRAGAARRLWAGDPRLFTPDSAHDASIASRLGWLHAPAAMASRTAELRAFAAAARADGIGASVLLGMGGSSLCAEVLARTFPAASAATGGAATRLLVLDSTDPAAVLAVEEAIEIPRTLFLVASKSGTTLEVKSFEAHFWERAVAVGGGAAKAGRLFCAITDPGTALSASAARKSYRATFENAADIGGRYSALSLFGLVPAAMLGTIDLDALVGSGVAMAEACGAGVAEAQSPGIRLGALLGAAAAAGRDKLTFVTSPELASFGSWAEQLVAESTGKEGRGIVPVDGEVLAAPDQYGPDRIFAFLLLEGSPESAKLREVAAALAGLGHPVVTIALADRHQLGGELFRWEVATAIAGALLGVNPFDEPNVTEAKNETNGILRELFAAGVGRESGHRASPPAASLPGATKTPDDARILRDHFATAKPGDYLCLSAYVRQTPDRDAAFSRLRVALRARAAHRNATTLGYGPRFLHSTGQLHKGGPNNAVFLQLTAAAEHDVPIPGEPFSFGQLRDAQADGDLAVLLRRERRALRVDLGPESQIEASLATLLRIIEDA